MQVPLWPAPTLLIRVNTQFRSRQSVCISYVLRAFEILIYTVLLKNFIVLLSTLDRSDAISHYVNSIFDKLSTKNIIMIYHILHC